MAGRRRGGALDSPDRTVFDHSTGSAHCAGVKAVGHLQCLGTQLWVGTAPGDRAGLGVWGLGFRVAALTLGQSRRGIWFGVC